ncbi:MAG TPA: hypothetical protein VLF41_02035 [Candidatus Nanoarchaeia archaeon]|nr:hypothetical protein [Candidatus Nanoarchaeia archaeon]
MIPVRQRQPLIDEADKAVIIRWLRGAVERMGFTVVRIPDSKSRYAHDEYRVPSCPPIELGWSGFVLPVS